MNTMNLHHLRLTLVLICLGGWVQLAFADPTPPANQGTGPSLATIAADDVKIAFAPYVWKSTGAGAAARAEATMPGAYLKVKFQGSQSIRLLIDGAANKGCPPASMPVVEYSIDEGPFKTTQLTKTDDVYPLPLADGLDAGKPHQLEFHFRSANLGPDRWAASTVHLRVAGVQLDAGGSLLPVSLHPRKAIGFGDSITEGVCAEGPCPYYSNLLMNNARVTWFPLVCAALDCEYGQLGTGGQGMVKVGMALPPLPQTWDHYDAATSRLSNGLLLPEPDYIFCAMGTNDFLEDSSKPSNITAAYTGWLAAVRKAAPHAAIFCVTPPLGWHAGEVAAAVAARNQEGDKNVHLIDTAPFKEKFASKRATQLAPDGVHPSLYGNAILGALIASEAQKVLCKGK